MARFLLAQTLKLMSNQSGTYDLLTELYVQIAG